MIYILEQPYINHDRASTVFTWRANKQHSTESDEQISHRQESTRKNVCFTTSKSKEKKWERRQDISLSIWPLHSHARSHTRSRGIRSPPSLRELYLRVNYSSTPILDEVGLSPSSCSPRPPPPAMQNQAPSLNRDAFCASPPVRGCDLES